MRQTKHKQNSGHLYRPTAQMTMKQVPLIESAPKLIFCDNYIETCRQSDLFRDFFASGDLENCASYAHLSTTSELVEVEDAVNRLRQSKGIEHLIPDEIPTPLKKTNQAPAGHKHRYDELLDQTAWEARQRLEAKQVIDMVRREERIKVFDGLTALPNEFDNDFSKASCVVEPTTKGNKRGRRS